MLEHVCATGRLPDDDDDEDDDDEAAARSGDDADDADDGADDDPARSAAWRRIMATSTCARGAPLVRTAEGFLPTAAFHALRAAVRAHPWLQRAEGEASDRLGARRARRRLVSSLSLSASSLRALRAPARRAARGLHARRSRVGARVGVLASPR